jgi:hypothetical protein
MQMTDQIQRVKVGGTRPKAVSNIGIGTSGTRVLLPCAFGLSPLAFGLMPLTICFTFLLRNRRAGQEVLEVLILKFY